MIELNTYRFDEVRIFLSRDRDVLKDTRKIYSIIKMFRKRKIVRNRATHPVKTTLRLKYLNFFLYTFMEQIIFHKLDSVIL